MAKLLLECRISFNCKIRPQTVESSTDPATGFFPIILYASLIFQAIINACPYYKITSIIKLTIKFGYPMQEKKPHLFLYQNVHI